RGVILLVVIVLLTLFAILGIAFVYYAQAEADSAGIFRDAASVQIGSTGSADAPPSQLLDEFLSQLIYDAPDNAAGVNSALRGHSLARTIYGWNDSDPSHNDKAYNGVGRVHTNDTSSATPAAVTFCNGYSQDDYLLPNYMWFKTLEGSPVNYPPA